MLKMPASWRYWNQQAPAALATSPIAEPVVASGTKLPLWIWVAAVIVLALVWWLFLHNT